MLLLHLGTLLLVSVQGMPTEEECCEEKMVGDVLYINIGKDASRQFADLNCLSPCIFEKAGVEGSRYCFAAGDLKVECEDGLEVTPRPGTEGPGGPGGPGGPEGTEGPLPPPGEGTEGPGGPEAPPTEGPGGPEATQGPGGPGVTVPNLPNPGSAGGTFEITIVQSWSQETDYSRVTEVKVPATEAGVKLPVIIDLHGNGGQGNVGRLSYLGDNVIIAAPSGYERSWNVNAEKSKADDVAFLLELIQKVVEQHPAADANDVTLLGTSNGAAITYRMLIETGIDRPFHRAIPMVSSLISVQYNDGKFYAAAGPDTTTNDYSVETVPVFADNFEYFHFHGTNDGALAYEGKCPGPGFLGAGVCVVPAQETDFAFARAMGYTGAQIPDADGVSVGDNMVEYSYLGGRVKHFKDIDGTHGSTFGDPDTEAQVKKIFGIA